MALQIPDQAYAFQINNEVTIIAKGFLNLRLEFDNVTNRYLGFVETTAPYVTFPYQVQKSFIVDSKLQNIVIDTTYGKSIPVQQIIDPERIIK